MLDLEIMARVYALLRPDGRWITGKNASDETGQPVAPEHSCATCFCLEGAITKETGDLGNRRTIAILNKMSHCIFDNGTGHMPVYLWNDAPGRTQQDVLGLVKRAIGAETSRLVKQNATMSFPDMRLAVLNQHFNDAGTRALEMTRSICGPDDDGVAALEQAREDGIMDIFNQSPTAASLVYSVYVFIYVNNLDVLR